VLSNDVSDDIHDILRFLESGGSVEALRAEIGTRERIGAGSQGSSPESGGVLHPRSEAVARSSGPESRDDGDRAEGAGIASGCLAAAGALREGPDGDRSDPGDDEPEDLDGDAPDDRGETSPRGVPDAAVKTFGKLRLSKNGKVWNIECDAHVAIRLKRLFPKAKPSEKVVHLSVNPETSDELRWFMERYPLEMDKRSAKKLHGMANEYLELQQKLLEISRTAESRPVPTMALPPRAYQVVASEIAYVSGRLLLADDLGLGKTVSALSLLAREGALPAAIVLPKHLSPQWTREIARFLPSTKTYTVRTTNPEKEKVPSDVDVWIVPYSRLSGWAENLQPRVNTVVFDEVHELRREESDKYSGAQTIAAEAKYRLGCSATPIWNYGAEFYSVVGVVAPGALGAWDEFSREWCTQGTERRKTRITDPLAFGAWLRDSGIMLRRTRREVGRQLPPVVRSVVEVEWSAEAFSEIEDAIINLATKTLTSNKETFQAAGQLDGHLRMATGVAKAPHVAALVRSILETTDDPVVLFGWHRDVYDIWLEALAEFKPVLYTGSEDEKEKDANLQAFIRGESRVLIMSLRSGQGVDGLQGTCHRVVFGELDWSPGALEQCLGRVWRDGQEESTLVYYAVCDEGSDPIMLDILDLKRWQQEGVIDPGGERRLDIQVDPDHIKRLAEEILRRRNIPLPEPVVEGTETSAAVAPDGIDRALANLAGP
jgi:superfamily II DNA or RNA helicase